MRRTLLVGPALLLAAAAFAIVPTASTATATALAYTDSQGALYLSTTGAASPKTIFDGQDSSVQALAVSPDGKNVLVYAPGDNDLALVPVAGGDPVTVKGTNDASSGQFSPDGKTIVFATNDGIYAVAATGGTAKKLLATPNGATDTLPVYSPSGKQLAFVRDAYDDNDNETVTLELYTVAGGSTKDLATGVLGSLNSGGRVSFSPDGKTIAFAGDYDNTGIFTVPVAGGDATQLTTDSDYWPSYSVDGKTIYFSRDASSSGAVDTNQDDFYELWSMTAGGDNAKVIAQGDFETLAVAPGTVKVGTTSTTGPTTTSTTTTSDGTTTTATPGALSVKLAIRGKKYKVSWTGTATAWEIMLKVGRKTSIAVVLGKVHTHTFTVPVKGAVTVSVIAV